MTVDVVRPDYRKSLAALRGEWEHCTKCSLGVYREAVGGKFVFGEGTCGGIMFVGEGPGATEEKEGRPFVGKSGHVLRHALTKLGVDRVYVSNIVACRSCGPSYDREGNAQTHRDRLGNYVPRIEDKPPTTEQMNACLPRLYEEIYLVDPLIIVALGAPAAKMLAQKAVPIVDESGTTMAITIPGAGSRPVLTAKKGLWARKTKGAIVAPYVQNQVHYLMMPLLHPAYVARKSEDRRWRNPVQIFAEGIRKAAHVYERYMLEVFGDTINIGEVTEDDILESLREKHG